MRAVLADLRRIGRFTPVAPYQRFAYVCGVLLVLSGLFHGVVYLIDGGPWEGPLSWRKPIVFGLSFGITLMTLAWIVGFLRPPRWAAWLLLGVFAFASLGEVFLISMQTWRGVASHFNEDTSFDGMVFSMMGFLVGLVALVTVAFTVWTFARMDAPASLALAIRLGLVLMLVSQVVGVQMIVEGSNTFGDSGALKVPHAVTLHAAQVLPALALLSLAGEYVERKRLEIVALGAAGYAALIASTMVLTYAGRSPLDLTAMSSALALLGLGLLAVGAVMASLGLAGRLRTEALGPSDAPRVS
jgi:hypothetical protein